MYPAMNNRKSHGIVLSSACPQGSIIKSGRLFQRDRYNTVNQSLL